MICCCSFVLSLGLRGSVDSRIRPTLTHASPSVRVEGQDNQVSIWIRSWLEIGTGSIYEGICISAAAFMQAHTHMAKQTCKHPHDADTDTDVARHTHTHTRTHTRARAQTDRRTHRQTQTDRDSRQTTHRSRELIDNGKTGD